jgi:LytS/YehU family sensor histidine kinase
MVTTRVFAALYIYNKWFAVKPETLTAKTYIYSVLSALFVVLFSIFFRLALNYFSLSKKQGEIRAEQIQTELNLLKQQVHPHFLFNTLNNIYYVAVKESPGAAELIERLSGIMRYFIEESRKDKVLLKDEIDLLKSYIELEGIRMRYEMPVTFTTNGNIEAVTVPPLMLLPLVENIFKHGVNKRSTHNFAEINLDVTGHTLVFSTRNMFYTQPYETQTGKTGLANLEKRLRLYYNNNYTLTAADDGNFFTATLQISIYEN